MANRNYIGFEVLANGNNAVSRILEVEFVILVFLDSGCGIEKWYWSYLDTDSKLSFPLKFSPRDKVNTN